MLTKRGREIRRVIKLKRKNGRRKEEKKERRIGEEEGERERAGKGSSSKGRIHILHHVRVALIHLH